MNSSKGPGGLGHGPLLKKQRGCFPVGPRVHGKISSELILYLKYVNQSVVQTSSRATLLSSHDLIICGLEYRHKGFFFLGKASLPVYILFIRYFHKLFSFYYPGPSFFPYPLQYSQTLTNPTFTGHHNTMNFQTLPPILSPIHSPPRNHTFEEPERDPRLRKTQTTRAKNKLLTIQVEIGQITDKQRAINKKREEIELQLEGIRLLQGDQAHKAACYHWCSPRMQMDNHLDRLREEKDKLKKKEETVKTYIQTLTPPSILTPPATPSPSRPTPDPEPAPYEHWHPCCLLYTSPSPRD